MPWKWLGDIHPKVYALDIPVSRYRASLPGKLQHAAETVKETKAEPTHPRRKKFADLTFFGNLENPRNIGNKSEED